MTTANQSTAERNITLVSVANIQPSNYNPRKRFDETGLDELSESIKQQGVLQPITCALLQTQTVTRLSLANADTVLPLSQVWKSSCNHIRTFRRRSAGNGGHGELAA